jgi:uncharacterized protein (TIGR04255 family)
MTADPYSQICYSKTFLKEVIVRVDLVNPLPDLDSVLPPPVSGVALRSFPIFEPTNALRREVQVSPESVADKKEKFIQWNFHTKDRTATFTIEPQAVFISHRAYITYELLRTGFIEILSTIADAFRDIQVRRVGLRYVNAIKVDDANPLDWSAYIDERLLSAFSFPPEGDSGNVSRVFHSLELTFESFVLRYRFGVFNPDYPAPIRRKEFILDLDAYTESAIDVRNIETVLDEYHATIQRYFERSINSNLRSVMNDRQ